MTGEKPFTITELLAVCDVLGIAPYRLLQDAEKVPAQRDTREYQYGLAA